jgi:hypothetical protein
VSCVLVQSVVKTARYHVTSRSDFLADDR